MARRITAAALILFAACGGRTRIFQGSEKPLSYAQYCSLEQGMGADAVQKAFGSADNVFQEDGKVRGLTYACEDASGKVLQLRMVFADDGQLQKWVLKDPKAPEPAEPPKATTAPDSRATS